MSTSYGSVPSPNDSHVNRGYGTGTTDFAQQGNPTMTSPLSQSAMQNQGAFTEDFDASQRGSSIMDGDLGRSASSASTAVGGGAGVSRNNTLKKKGSVRRTTSLKRSGSKKSLRAGSIKGVGGGVGDNEDFHSAFFTPVPTTGTPTEILANRFQSWRQLLKSLITYFREIQNSYDTRAKALHKVQNTISNITHPTVFMSEHGLGEATRILDDYHKRSIAEATKSRDIENDVLAALTGLRSDLGQKIKEIKSLSGDFKNSVEKEKDATRREVEKLQEALQHADHEDAANTGKGDPYVVRLGVDRAIEKQIDEENYLHRAYLNLESSGRELESIVVGEIQKAYNALASILKREGDDAYSAVEHLRTGPISIPKDQEWYTFVTNDPHFVDPNLPVRRVEDIEYPGKHAPAATEIRAGMLERKSKYLKSYTPGWYVLSPTHLHEFKSADKIYSQPPVMSLYLLDQKLGSHSEPGSSSHKFMLKGRQSGSMHKGHNWVFRAESYDTMMAWFEDIRILTEKTGEERIAFVRKHARSVSGTSERGTVSSDGLEDDEADQAPYSADAASLAGQHAPEQRPQRPQPGGRFPSDMVLRKTGTMSSTNDGADDSDSDDRDAIVAAGAIPGSAQRDYGSARQYDYGDKDPYRMEGVGSDVHPAAPVGAPTYAHQEPWPVQQQQSAFPAQQAATTATAPVQTQTYSMPTHHDQPLDQQQPLVTQQPFLGSQPVNAPVDSLAEPARQSTSYGDWMAPAAAGVAGVGAGALGANAYQRHQREAEVPVLEDTNTTARDFDQAEMERSPVSPISADTGVDTVPMVPVEVPGAGAAEPSTTAEPSTVDVSSTGVPDVSAITLGGNERQGAHETGQLFPRVIRHDTNMSISGLHVPGEFPKKT